MKGAVRSYDARRGMGFISPDGGGDDIAVHANELESAGFPRLQRRAAELRREDGPGVGRRFAMNLGKI